MPNKTAQASTPSPASNSHNSGGNIGRPSTFSPAVAELICYRLAGGETLAEICRTPGMPSRSSIHRWRMQMPDFWLQYARAREIGIEKMADDILTISDDDTGDVNPDGTPNSANVQRSRLQVDTRKFLMAKIAPKVYGDRLAVEHSGSVEHRVTLSDRERMRRLALFLAEDQRAGTLIEGTASEQQQDDQAPTSPLARPDLADTHSAPMNKEPTAHDDEL